MTDVYERLARFLDELPGGLPRSQSGVEVQILRKLFTPQEAEIAQKLSLLAEEAHVIAHRAGLPVEEGRHLLEELDRKRLIYCFPEEGKPRTYMAQQFLIGFWESQVDRLDRELVELFEEYLPVFAKSGVWGKAPQLRTIPVKESIPHQGVVLNYENVEAILGSHQTFAVANCICRQEMRILGHDCGKPLETCMAFDGGADYFVRTQRGRTISREEAIAIIAEAERSGLVLQPGNDRTSGNLCMCCGCCCGVLRGAKMHPRPVDMLASPFIAVVDDEKCAGCGTCLERCQMEALDLPGGTVVVDLARCIGCGLCVTTCPSEALSLRRKPEADQPRVPRNVVELNIRMAQARGKLGPGSMIRMVARSAVDRVVSKR
jgi:Na+-translocating ferredoxin:NAD+ oxidoreductase subunit B